MYMETATEHFCYPNRLCNNANPPSNCVHLPYNSLLHTLEEIFAPTKFVHYGDGKVFQKAKGKKMHQKFNN